MKAKKDKKAYKHTQEAKDKISKAHKGLKHTQETKDKMSKAKEGFKHTQEAKDKISKANKGKTLSQEHIQSISMAHKGKKTSQETRDKISASCKGRAGRPVRVWTAEEKVTLQQFIEAGAGVTTIMKEMDMSHKHVTAMTKELGLVITGWTREQDEKLIQLVSAETNLKDIVTAMGVTAFKIKGRVKALDAINGTDLTGQVYPGKGRYRACWTEEQLSILKQYENDNEELVKRLPFCITTIKNKIKEIKELK